MPILPAMFVSTWLGLGLLPETHGLLRAPAAAALAVLAGLGSDLCGATGTDWPRGLLRARWVVPAGAVLAAVGWLSSLPERPWVFAPLGAAVIVGLTCLQAIELKAPEPLRGAAHAINIGAGFALAYGAYVLAAPGPAPVAVGASLVTSAAVSLIVLRGESDLGREELTYAAVTALAVAELSWLLHGTRASPLLLAAVLVLALYAVSGICHALLDRAPGRAYLEVATVTLVSLGAAMIVGGRP